jgi:HPt (histidine-containing phosphotransfer) domain-containing protein
MQEDKVIEMNIGFVSFGSRTSGVSRKEDEPVSDGVRWNPSTGVVCQDFRAANNGTIVADDSSAAVNNLFGHLAIVDEAARQEIEEIIGDDEGYTELIQQFLCEGGTWLDQLDTAVAEEDMAGLRRISHTLKGSCASIGVARITAMLGKVEEAARAGHVDYHLAVRLRSEWEEVRAYLRPWGM